MHELAVHRYLHAACPCCMLAALQGKAATAQSACCALDGKLAPSLDMPCVQVVSSQQTARRLHA